MNNILILAAGNGRRFKETGKYSFPKPLIEVPIPGANKTGPLLELVVSNLKLKGRYIFLVLKEHYDNYSLKYLLPLICGNNPCEIITVDKTTEGAACTALLAKNLINNDEELIIANSDQWVNWNSEHFINFIKSKKSDGCILTFNSTHPKFSFVRLDENTNLITEVAEKKPISQVATCGIYHFSKGSDFVSGAEEMIKRNIRVNNEFYLAPTYNILIEKGKKICHYPVAEMNCLGDPESLESFLRKDGI